MEQPVPQIWSGRFGRCGHLWAPMAVPRFQPLNCAASEIAADRIPNRAGFKRVNDDGETEYLVLTETFKTEVCAGHNYRTVLSKIERLGWLRRQHPELTIRMRLPEMGMARVFCINEAILEGAKCTDG